MAWAASLKNKLIFEWHSWDLGLPRGGWVWCAVCCCLLCRSGRRSYGFPTPSPPSSCCPSPGQAVPGHADQGRAQAPFLGHAGRDGAERQPGVGDAGRPPADRRHPAEPADPLPLPPPALGRPARWANPFWGGGKMVKPFLPNAFLGVHQRLCWC